MAAKPGPPGYVLTEGRNFINSLVQRVGSKATVLEVGANDGMHTRLFLEEFKDPDFRIYCFEPDPRPCERFKTNVQDPRCQGLFQLALGAKDGKATFYQSGGTNDQSWLDDWDLSGSLRKPTKHMEVSPWVTFDREITVEVARLDSWMKKHPEIKTIEVLWADVQGCEVDLIQGGAQTFLRKVEYFYTEFYQTPLYEGQINLAQIKAMLPTFEEVSIHGDNVLLRNRKFVEG